MSAMPSEGEVARAWLEAMDRHDLPRMASLYAPNAVGDEVADPPARDRKGLEESYRELFEGFPDCRAEILNLFGGGGQVAAEIRWTGTNERPFRGQPATQKRSDLRIAYLFKVVSGKIERITEYYDSASV